MTLYQPPPDQTSIDPHVEIYGTPLKSSQTWAALLHLVTLLMWKLATVFKLPLERLENCGSVYGQCMVFQFPQSGRCTRQLCFQHYCIQQRHTLDLYRRHFRKLSKVHLRHLRQILRISRKDHIPNVEVFRRGLIYPAQKPL